ncbi:unnamed protein product [Arabis nemorensis]|uniref:Gnk2-homologous domain-containing protein n=1 Tax=Arabis nemorensis TaxID=586526 RepID=A0A565B3A5_9BRAS|nr:unnamed protein product [Arabis nemorensis]
MSQPQHIYTFCDPSSNFTQPSPYAIHRQSLLSTLQKFSRLGTYSNATIGPSPDTVYGMYLCRGDINATSCFDCVLTATMEIARNCSHNKAAVIYYQKCMVRYSNVSFFTLMETRPSVNLHPLNQPAPNLNRFNKTLTDKFDQLILNVSSSSSIPYFVQDQERVIQPEGSYELESMIQCSPDLDLSNCTVCLKTSFLRFFSTACSGLPSVAQIFTPKCLLWYKTSVLPSPPPPLT